MNADGEVGEELDETDMKILSLLQEDAFSGYEYIGDQVGLSESAVRYRIRKMQDLGVILGFTCALDHDKLGYRILGFAGIDVTPGKEKLIAGKVGSFPNVVGVFTISNTFDMIAMMMLRNKEELAEVIGKIRSLKGVAKVDFMMVLNTHKWDCAIKMPANTKEEEGEIP
ncbi:Lrp/AsnC family transcriptional regulator [Candidatus Bathyarchaeota archaeon]|nr:Lrp/AsnC family transcriptional regulator [Candidatus Bathyarchaeota archaeon]MBS7631485.1 Lrp/AsnC family transcriptional regulator [Candidatus Bathyarchaeota archaeon]